MTQNDQLRPNMTPRSQYVGSILTPRCARRLLPSRGGGFRDRDSLLLTSAGWGCFTVLKSLERDLPVPAGKGRRGGEGVIRVSVLIPSLLCRLQHQSNASLIFITFLNRRENQGQKFECGMGIFSSLSV
jgi:hypothetical protein